MRDPERILLVRLSHLGDVVHALAVFHALHEAYPRARIAWAIQPEYAPLVAPLPGLARTVPFERRGGWRAWPRAARLLAGFGADLAVDAQGNLKSAAITWLSRAPRRAGPARADWREPLGALVLTERAPAVPAAGRLVHAMERMHALARFLAPSGEHPPRHDPALRPEEREAGRRALAERLGPAGSGAEAADGPPVLCHLSSPEDVRAWPLGHWAALVAALAERGRRVAVLAGPGERAAARRLEALLAGRDGRARRIVHWRQEGLRELAGVLAAAAERGAPLVACDTGPLHLAAACGARTVLLAGPQDERRTGPWPPAGAGHRVVRASPGPACAPCLARRCHHPRGPVCMAELAPEAVAAVVAGAP